MKLCTKCKEYKALSEYNKGRARCKKCIALEDKIRFAKKGPLYSVWSTMRSRCNNPNDRDYYKYGARGITVCSQWDSFETFKVDVGERPSPLHSLDRINNNKGYEPDNIRWATFLEQNRNQRSTKLTETIVWVIRDTPDISDKLWAEMLNCTPGAIYNARRGITWKNVPGV